MAGQEKGQVMERIEQIRQEIKATEKILEEAAENLKANPDNYSAKLLYLSTENHLGDLFRRLDMEEMKKNISR